MNIYELIKENNKNNGRKQALSITTEQNETRVLTYDGLFAAVDRFAERLADRGLCRGDRVALVAENAPEWTAAFLAILKAGGTAVLLDASLLPEDLLRQIILSDVRCLFFSPRVIKKMSAVVPRDLAMLDLSRDGEPVGDNAHSQAVLPPTADGDESVAAIIYSSGTTRAAAGIMHSHDALIETTLMCARSNKLTAKGKYLAVVPNSHIYGLICSVLGPMLLGADVRFIEMGTAAAIVKAFAEYRPTVFPCVPRVFELFKSEIDRKIAADPKTKRLFDLFFPICLSLRKKTGINLGKLLFKTIHQGFGGRIEIFCSAGAPMDSKTAEFYIGTGFNMLITYGATETNIPTLGNRGRNLTTDSCGLPYPGVDVKMSDSGELLIKSPYMMKGYFRDRELTEGAFEDGWFKTGDLCRRDARGNYVIVGRSKENIVLATGKKVIPDDVEKAYNTLAGVKELIVCGVPAPGKHYDDVHAFVVKQDQTVSADGLSADIHRIGAGLPAHMRITRVHYVDEIPRTSLQKPKRYLLKKLAAEEIETAAVKTASVKTAADAAEPALLADEIIGMIAETGQFDRRTVTMNARPFSGLGLDSLSSIELALRLESRFGLRVDQSFTQTMTVADIVGLIGQADAGAAKAVSTITYPKSKKLSDYRLFRHLGNLARLFYKIRISNEKVIPSDSGFILCANHVSNFDYLWLTINFNRKRFEKFCCMAKQELLNKSKASRILTQICGMIPVDRAHTHVETMACCRRQLKEQWGLLVHPEGTRSENGELGAFKKGAAVLAIETNVPIIPAYIHGAYDIYPKGSKLPRLFDFRRMRKYAVEVVYGAPIFPLDQTADELIQKVKDAIMNMKGNLTRQG